VLPVEIKSISNITIVIEKNGYFNTKNIVISKANERVFREHLNTILESHKLKENAKKLRQYIKKNGLIFKAKASEKNDKKGTIIYQLYDKNNNKLQNIYAEDRQENTLKLEQLISIKSAIRLIEIDPLIYPRSEGGKTILTTKFNSSECMKIMIGNCMKKLNEVSIVKYSYNEIIISNDGAIILKIINKIVKQIDSQRVYFIAKNEP